MARGTIVKRKAKNGEPLYYMVYRVGGSQKWEKAGSNKKDAEALLSERVRRITMGCLADTDKTFGAVVEQFLADTKASKKLGTYLDYSTTFNKFITPHFGKLKVKDITNESIRSFKNRLVEKLNPGYVNKVLTHIGTAFRYAQRNDYTDKNPAEHIQKLSLPHKEILIYTPAQVAKLLSICEEPYRTMFLISFFAGLRPGELFALKWGDVDFDASRLLVRRNVMFASAKYAEEGKRYRFQSPKTKRGFRSVDVSPAVKKALEIHRLNTIEQANPLDLVFSSEVGTPHDPLNIVRRHFKPALVTAGLPEIRYYDARHFFASRMISMNYSPKYIMEQMGHSSIQVTMDVYGHLFPSSQSRIGGDFDIAIEPSNSSLTREPETAQTKA